MIRKSKRVVVTGLGSINSLGNNVTSFWNNLISGESGIDKIKLFDCSTSKTKIAAEVKSFNLDKYNLEHKLKNRMSRYMQLCIAATQEAIDDSNITVLKEIDNIGVSIGSGIGGIEVLETNMKKMFSVGPKRISPYLIPMMTANSAAGLVSILFNLKGPCLCSSTACTSGADSIINAYQMIQNSSAKVMITGGSEAAITQIGIGGFDAMNAMCSSHNDNPKNACKPFDKNRDGFVMGEGAGILILEELEHALNRGAKIYAELIGTGRSSDAYHITSPDNNGDGAIRAMNLALRNSNTNPKDVNYINAHGTSTILNDKIETLAIKEVFKDHAKNLNISSTKGATGHCLGASGAIEAIIAIKSIEKNIIPPTLNLNTRDKECDLNYTPGAKVTSSVNIAMSNSFGFGGHNSVLVFKSYKRKG